VCQGRGEKIVYLSLPRPGVRICLVFLLTCCVISITCMWSSDKQKVLGGVGYIDLKCVIDGEWHLLKKVKKMETKISSYGLHVCSLIPEMFLC
jgi:hypothetical protein